MGDRGAISRTCSAEPDEHRQTGLRLLTAIAWSDPGILGSSPAADAETRRRDLEGYPSLEGHIALEGPRSDVAAVGL